MQGLLGPTWIEINLDAIAQNVRNIKKLIGKKTELNGSSKRECLWT